MDTPKKIFISKGKRADYKRLLFQAIEHIRNYDLSDASRDALFNEGIAPLTRFMLHVAEELSRPTKKVTVEVKEVEAAFAVVGSELVRGMVDAPYNVTVKGLMVHAAMRHSALKRQQSHTGLIESLREEGAQIQVVLGCLVLTDPGQTMRPPGKKPKPRKIKFADKTEKIVKALRELEILPKHFLIYTGGLRPNMMRQVPYLIIDISSINKQIAVCDQIGEITFVAHKPLPPWQWTRTSKNGLKALPQITTHRYDGHGEWLNKLRRALKSDNPITNAPYADRTPLLTEEKIVEWVRFFHEKTGKWPSQLDEEVWDKDEKGNWVQVRGERWGSIDVALTRGSRGLEGGSSLAKLKEKYGLNDDLPEDKLLRWIELYHEKTGKLPSRNDKVVWDKNEKAEWIQVEGESWTAIDTALQQGSRGFKKGSSLSKFKIAHGLVDRPRQRTMVMKKPPGADDPS